jgi:ABC-type microcin C transport system permease subunit YejE
VLVAVKFIFLFGWLRLKVIKHETFVIGNTYKIVAGKLLGTQGHGMILKWVLRY